MMGRKLLAVFLSSAVASPGWAAGKVVRPPSVGTGTSYGVDPYVAEFEQKMRANNAALEAMKKAIESIKIPEHSQKGATAAKLAIVAEFVGMAALKADAAAAVKKITDHLKGLDDGRLKFGATPKSADFGDKRDDSSLKPKEDRTLRRSEGAGGSMNASYDGGGVSGSGAGRISSLSTSEHARDAVGSHPSGQSGAFQRPSLHPMNAPVGYGGQVGAGFGAAPMAVKASYGAPPSAERTSDPQPIGMSPGAGSSADDGAGMRSGGGSSPGASVGKTEGDSKPGTNPANDSLSKNSSDVAAKAAAAKEKAAADAKAARDKAAEDEKQRQQQQQQMAMQAAQQAAQAAAQAAGKQKQQQQGQGQGGGGGQGLNQEALNAVQEQARQNGALQQQVTDLKERTERQAQQIQDLTTQLNEAAPPGTPPPAP